VALATAVTDFSCPCTMTASGAVLAVVSKMRIWLSKQATATFRLFGLNETA
jgi:hypothetical protein